MPPAGMRKGPVNLRRRNVLPRAPFWKISGVTRDTNSAALGNCTVKLFTSTDNAFQASTISDASGNYAFYTTLLGPFYCTAYKTGAPDVAGTTVNTLTQTLASGG